MKNKLVTIIFALLIINTVYANTENKMTLILNDTVFGKETFIVKNNRIHVPIRIVAENLGAKVKWNNNEKSININKDDRNIKFTIDSNDVYSSDMNFKIDSTPFILNDKAYVPLRVLANGIDAKIKWDEEKFTCYVYNGLETNIYRPFDPKKDSKNLDLIQDIRKITDKFNYLDNSKIKVKETNEGKEFTLYLEDYEEEFMSMTFRFDNKNKLTFYKFKYLPSENHPFSDANLNYEKSKYLAREFLNLIGEKNKILDKKQLNKSQILSPDNGLFFFYTKDGSSVLVDASLGLVCGYKK